MVLMIRRSGLPTRQDRRPHLLHHPHRAGIFQINSRQDQHANLLQMRQLVSQLQHAADRHRQASASTGGWKYGAANSAKPIILTLRNVGAKAGTEKRFRIEDRPHQRSGEISKI